MNPSLPRPEAIIVAPAIAAYVGRLQSLDPFGESPGKPSKEGFASPREVLDALHHVLSGGQVRIEIVSHGSASQVEEAWRIARARVSSRPARSTTSSTPGGRGSELVADAVLRWSLRRVAALRLDHRGGPRAGHGTEGRPSGPEPSVARRGRGRGAGSGADTRPGDGGIPDLRRVQPVGRPLRRRVWLSVSRRGPGGPVARARVGSRGTARPRPARGGPPPDRRGPVSGRGGAGSARSALSSGTGRGGPQSPTASPGHSGRRTCG